jgi:membrane-bound metal-dependent hydrolase YbcI (DUF457 family)
MPLPLGHAAIGLATHELISRNRSATNNVVLAVFVVILANLPDIDVLIGLFLRGNGMAFHRGITHSYLFAFFMGILASHAWRFWSKIPRVNFTVCFLLIVSHLIADFFFTRSPVSFFWPFGVYTSQEQFGLIEIITPIFCRAYKDAGIIIICIVALLIGRIGNRPSHYDVSFLSSSRSHKIHKDI